MTIIIVSLSGLSLLLQVSKRNNKEKEVADDELGELIIPDLSKVLSKCVVEEAASEDGQPLFIDESCDMIKCNWCPGFKGSIELRVLNQHCKTAKSHTSMRKKLLGEESAPSTQGLQKITDYFRPVL